MLSLSEVLVASGSFLLLMFIVQLFENPKKKSGLRRRQPPSMPSVPILGSFPFMKNFDAIHLFLLEKSYELGPVFYVNLGSRRILVLNNRESIEDALVKHASSFSGRERFYTEKHHFNLNQKGIAFRNYDAEFKKYQKLILSILRDFGLGSKSLMETRILTEVTELIEHFRKLKGSPFNPKEIINLSVSNAPMNILLGRRTKYEDGTSEVCAQMKTFVTALDPALDFFPILRFVPPHNSRFKNMKAAVANLLPTITKEIGKSLKEGADDSFVRSYVDREGPGYDQEELMYTLRDFIGGSTDTTATTMLWALVFFANNRQVVERAQREMDLVIGRESLPRAADEQRLPYTVATVLEVQRHRSALPMAIPHLTLHDTEVLGYFVPADTVVIANVQAANMHRADWMDPEEFRPERFLDEEGNLVNKYQPIPFSLGRRSCIGEPLARQQLFLYIAAILQNFTVRPPDGVESVVVKRVNGVVEHPSTYEIRMIPRAT